VATSVAFTEVSDDSAQYSDTATLQARLVDAAGAPLAGEQLGFTLGAASAAAVTDADGVAGVSLPVSEAPGEARATVSYAGLEGALAPAVASAPFTVQREDTTLVLAHSGTGRNRQLTATLADADSGAPVAGRTIVFLSNGEEIGRGVTDESGSAVFDTKGRHASKNATFEAVFEGDSHYLGAADS
jgi:hypothetical protein